MKVIELLIKIANGEEVPKKIRYEGKDMFWCEPCKIYEVDVEQKELCGTDLYSILDNLNDEVEVIEDKKIKKLPPSFYENACLTKQDVEVANKINEIIDKINKLETK